MGFQFFITAILLGVGLAMDAFSVSLANGLHDPKMKKRKMTVIAGVFAFFQALMPMLGWVCVHTVVEHFKAFEAFIPWIALGLLGFIGGKMLYEGIRGCDEEENCDKICFATLMIQGVATSIDALSVGFTIAEYGIIEALIAVTLIAAITFVICFCGLWIGKKFGAGLACKATIFGGSILIIIGIEIFISGLLG